MHLTELWESIKRFEIIDAGLGTSFDDQDRRLLTSNSYEERLRKAFSKTPFSFDVYVVNHLYNQSEWTRSQRTNTNVMSPEYVQEKFIPDFQHDPSTITLLITNNFADSKHPLTPWIVAHRFCHVVDSARGSGKRKSRFGAAFDNFVRDVTAMYESLGYHLYGSDVYYEIVPTLTMKSARQKDRTRLYDGEAQHELLTQFIVNGVIKLTVDHLVNSDPIYYSQELRDGLIKVVRKNERTLNREAANDLSRAVGQIFVI